MFMLSGSAAAVVFGVLVVIFLSMLACSLGDTTRGIREFFDVRVIRNFLRSIFRFRFRYSLASLLFASFLLPPSIAAFVEQWKHGFSLGSLVAITLLIVTSPLIYWFVVEAFGRSPRERWKKILRKDNSPWGSQRTRSQDG